MRFFLFCTGIFYLFYLTACTTQVERVDYAPLIEVPQDRKAAPADLRRVVLDVPVGARTGQFSTSARNCHWPFVPLNRTDIKDSFDKESLRYAFDERMEALGYDIVGGREIIFDDEQTDEVLRTEYLIGARVTSVNVNICKNNVTNLFLFFQAREGIEGELQMNVEWTIYDRLRQKTVYKTSSKGYARRKVPNREGLTLLMNDAFAMAAHNLGNSEDFRNVLYFEIPPSRAVATVDDDHRPRPRQFQSDEKIFISALPLSRGALTDKINLVRRAIVLVQAGKGHGSGFFISREGHILTNSHVVGDALRVRVETAFKDHKLIAEVLRRDTGRDVAVLKLIDMPEDLDIPHLPIRSAWPDISETVYVVGAPRLKDLSETVTKGIVSAHRRNFRQARNKNFIQADVTINSGNSGGPLFDAHGNVVGITVAGFFATQDQVNLGLNLFIPIGEALDKLNIEMHDHGDVYSGEHKRPMVLEPGNIISDYPGNKASPSPNNARDAHFSPRGLNIHFHGDYLSPSPSRSLYYRNVSADNHVTTLDD